MEKEFIPYNEALALKGLGFDEPCLACYTPAPAWMKNKTPIIKGHFVNEFKQYFNSKLKTENVAAPLYQQAFRWFREKYGIKTYVYEVLEERFVFITYTNTLDYKMSSTYHTTYEEAELECLKKLIEITKQ